MSDPRTSAKEANRVYMLSLFRQAIPEIDPEAEIVFTEKVIFPTNKPISEAQYIDLKEYEIAGPGESVFRFTIAYLPEPKLVIVRRIPREDLPEDVLGEFYVIHYLKTKYIP